MAHCIPYIKGRAFPTPPDQSASPGIFGILFASSVTLTLRKAICRPSQYGHIATSLYPSMPQSSSASSKSVRAIRAFSLVELLAVIAILGIMLALLAPAVKGFASTAGRKGAVNILMNTFEQARVAALESGRTVYILFYRRTFPDQDAIMVLREPDPISNSKKYDQLTRWIKLPSGILLHEVGGSNILSQPLPPTGPGITGFDPQNSPISLKTRSGESLNLLAFNPYGQISFPTDSKKLMLIVSEGVRDNNGTEALISAKKEHAGGFEIITFRRYTGRSSLEVSTL
jgi:prepilin-type N-terminal cleavage/methylation domain-containing protein